MDRGDRGALTALGMTLAAVVIVSFVATGSRNPSDGQVGQPNATNVDQRHGTNVTNLVSGADDFRPWRDTYAQWLMALLSFAATGVSLWAVHLVRSTLQETRNTANAARESNVVAREVGEAQVRAYLTVTRIAVGYGGDLLTPHVAVTIKNSGQSPALMVSVAYVASSVFNKKIDAQIVNPGIKTYPLAKHIGANSESHYEFAVPKCNTLAKKTDPIPDNIAFRIEGIIEYQTVFGVSRNETDRETAFMGAVIVGPKKILTLDKNGNRPSIKLRMYDQIHPEWAPEYIAIITSREKNTKTRFSYPIGASVTLIVGDGNDAEQETDKPS